MTVNKPEVTKSFSIWRTFRAFKYSYEGFKYAYTHEQSMLLHVTATVMAVSAGLWLEIDKYEWFFVLLLIGLVVGIELLNTAIEAVVDLITEKQHPLAKIAKDTDSEAVFALSITAFVGGCIIYLPNLIEKLF